MECFVPQQQEQQQEEEESPAVPPAAAAALAAVAARLQTPLGAALLDDAEPVAPAAATALVRDCLALLAPAAGAAPARVLTEAGRVLLAARRHAPAAPLAALAPPRVAAQLLADVPVPAPPATVAACARVLLERAGALGAGDAWVLLCDLPALDDDYDSDSDSDSEDGVVTVDCAAEDARVEALLARGAACGSAAAVLALAERRYYGVGGRADAGAAVRAWAALAARGEPAALLRLGAALEAGVPGVLAADRARAHACVARAAAAGARGAARRLGEQLLDGCGCGVAVLRGAALLRGCAECRARDPVLLDRLAALAHAGVALADAPSALAVLAHPVPALEPLVLACLRALAETLARDVPAGAPLAPAVPHWRARVAAAVARQCAPGCAHCASAALLMARVLDGSRDIRSSSGGDGNADADDDESDGYNDARRALVRLARETLAREGTTSDSNDGSSSNEGGSSSAAWLVPHAREQLAAWLEQQTESE